MIDNLSIGLTHALLAILIWRLLSRNDLDIEPAESGLLIEPKAEQPARPVRARAQRQRRKKPTPG